MNFNWANELAKNALKTAQKRIDSVLDIAPEDEVEGDEEFNALIASPVEGSEEQGKKLLEQHDGWTESNDSFYAAYDMAAMGQSGGGNAELGKDTNPTEWISQWSSQGDEVVDSEPNPIRDSHHSGLLQHSPDSNSPEELVCNGEEQDDCHSNDASKSKEATEQLPNLQLNALDVSKHSVIDAISRKNDQQHDETLTLVSSDFEVLRQSDSCSIASSITPKSLPALTPGTSTADLHQQVPETTEKISSSANKQSVNSEIAHLKTQIQYQERRIRDLQLQNQRLEAKTKELLALKVVRTQQSSAEVRIMKKLSEKEMELADLLQEGEKLAKTNGKLMNELKKLRASLSEYEQLAKKSAQAEIDRDLAREEVRGLMTETTKLRNTINSLEAELGELKIANEGLMIDLKKRDDKIGRLLVNIQESEASRELAYEELRQMESVVAEISSKVEQREMTTKNVEEITRGLSADLEEEKRKNDQQANYIDSLEKRLSEMMETQRNNAEMVAVATAPLLESIQRLEEEISVKDNECKQIVNGKEAVIGTLKAEKERLTRENTEISTENNQDDKSVRKVPESMENQCGSSEKSNHENSPVMKKRSDFIFLDELGEGSFSTVYHIKERSTGREFAAKVCSKKQIVREKKVDYVYREKEALIRLSHGSGQHPFLMQVMCTFQDFDHLYIVMTLARKGDLLKLLRSSGEKFDFNMAQFYSSEIVAALEHMHALNIIHRDLKPENILISETGHILVSDFGSAKILDRAVKCQRGQRQRSSFVGTAQYVSPEVLNGEPVQQACDYWALGVIIYQFFTGKHAFHDVSEYLIYRRILRATYTIPDSLPRSAANILRKLLVVKPENRLGSVETGGANAVKGDPYFAGINWDLITKTEPPHFSTVLQELQQRIQENDIVVTRLTERIQQLELQNKRLESNSIKLSHEVEELTKSLIEKEDEIERVYIRLREKTDMLEMRIKQKQNEVDVARKHSEALEDELRKVLTHSNESLIQQQRLGKRVNFMPNNQMQHTSSIGLPNFAIQAELADAHSKYEQSMRQISALEQKISSMEAESRHLSVLRNELQALKSLYGNLLEAHGEKIERIEELEMDLADMKKLMKDQVEYFLAKNE